MPIFQDRPARFDLNVPLTFVAYGELFRGHCVNVSQSGMLAMFAPPVDLFVTGQLALEVGEYTVSIHARVARTQGLDAGLSFLIATENDRRTIAILLEFATAHLQPAGAQSQVAGER